MKDQSNDIQELEQGSTRYIRIREDTAIEVNASDGKIAGAHAEGTLGIVIYGGDPNDLDGKRFRAARAIRIPRLLQSDILLNFHVAEIAYHESRQAARFGPVPFVLGASGFYRFEHANPFSTIPNDESQNPCFVGFYLSPLSHYELCLVSKTSVWPAHFAAYLAERKLTAERLFERISELAEPEDAKIFSSLLFLPDRRGTIDDSADREFGLKVLNRRDLDSDRARRDVGGWWFNIPVAIYPWMSANLERLLAAYLDESDAPKIKPRVATLRGWPLRSWFHLLRQLALGVKALHADGAIHGDPRPANIMTHLHGNNLMEPENFRWIDIGLGYGAKDVLKGLAGLDDQTIVTPRPLGGGRSTIFYAPEREEAHEFEDADIISLERHGDSETDLSKLTFYSRKETHSQDTTPLLLKEGDKSKRELGELIKGDRIQVREFLFEVEDVMENHIIVSRIYEIFLDRVLVEKRAAQRDVVRNRLSSASISRYRIFKQWSQATDIYGLGMIALYLFFNRGLYLFRAHVPQDTEKTDPAKTVLYDRANREKIFHELAVLLRNRSFLENVLIVLAKKNFSETIPAADQAQNEGAATDIASVILASDANFEFIRFGVNGNDDLFNRLIYFCLCCVWRLDETSKIIARVHFPFTPFSKSRSVIESVDEQAKAAEMAYQMLDKLIPLTATASEAMPDSLASGRLGEVREEQINTLRQSLENKDEELKQLQQRTKTIEESLSRCVAVENELRNEVGSTRTAFLEIETAAAKITEELASKRLFAFPGKKQLVAHIDRLRQIAEDGAARNTTNDPD